MSFFEYHILDLFADLTPQALLYESLIEQEPNNFTHYWHLGLIYLLQNREEDGRDVWFYALAQNLAITDIRQQELVTFLEQKAKNYQSYHPEAAWLIRQQIQSLVPEQLNNTLHLIELSCQLGKFTSTDLQKWQILPLLANSQMQDLDLHLLLKITVLILHFPTVISGQFLAISLPHLLGIQGAIETILNVANKMAFEQKQPSYSAYITSICLQVIPDVLYIWNDLLNYYQLSHQYDALLNTAWQLYYRLESQSLEPAIECYWFSRILTALLQQNAWLTLTPVLQRFQNSLQTLLNTSSDIQLDPFFRDRFWGLGYPLLYLNDDPKNNRLYLNKLAEIFQHNIVDQYPIYQANFNIQLTSSPPLRIGYIGHTFYQHSMGWLGRWLYHYHDKQNFQLYFYSVNHTEDDLTRNWIYPNAHQFYKLGQNSQAIAEQIRKDHIHILVDLDSLTYNVTAQVLALKPAPIQVNWIGFDASGLPAIDYFIVDSHIVSETAQQDYREQLWFLPKTCIAVDNFEIGETTLSREQLGIPEDSLIYINFQNKIKINPEILRLQLQIIKAVPNSFLLVKGDNINQNFQQLIQQLCQEIDLTPQRIYLLPKESELNHRGNLSIVDIALDTYPYSGATTTLETLWMEIPLVTKVGQQFAARNSYAFLQQLGIQEGIAWSDREYLEWGIRLGTDNKLRKQVKEKLARAKRNSPLWQAEQFTREMEKAYLQMWQEYLKKQAH